MACTMRLWNPEWKSTAITAKEVVKNDVHGRNLPYIEIMYTAASSASATEVGGAADNVLNGTTTPVQVYVDAAAATDTDSATGHVRKVRIIGISVASSTDFQAGNEDPVFSLEEVNLSGQTAVVTTRYYLRLMHFYACDWGSGGDEASNSIYVQDDAGGTTKYLTIAAAANESNASIIYGCENHFGRTVYCNCCAADAAFNNT